MTDQTTKPQPGAWGAKSDEARARNDALMIANQTMRIAELKNSKIKNETAAPTGNERPSKTTRDDPVMAALGATTGATPESIQYVLIRGLSAMGHAQPTTEARALMEAALAAAGQQQATAFDDGMILGRRSALMRVIKNLQTELDTPEGAE